MKCFFTTLFSMLLGMGLAQVPTITNTSLPSAGDVLVYLTAEDVGAVNLNDNGIDKVWDFSSWVNDGRDTTVFQAASQGNAAAEFPTANLVVATDGINESYFRSDGNVLSLIGEYSFVDLLGAQFPVPYEPAFDQVRTPITVGSNFSASSTNYYGIAAADLPAAIIDSLPIPIDSVRILGAFELQSNAIATGTLTVGGMAGVPVVCVRDTSTFSITVEVKAPFVGWIDLAAFIQIPGTGQSIGSVVYNFYAVDQVGPVLTVSQVDALATSAQWQDIDLVLADREQLTVQQARFVGNPSPPIANFEWNNLELGDYQLEIYSLDGKQRHQQPIAVYSSSGNIAIDLTDCHGTVVYRFWNPQTGATASGLLVRN